MREERDSARVSHRSDASAASDADPTPPASRLTAHASLQASRPAPHASLWTRPYFLLLLAILLCYVSQWLQMAILPLYVHDLGASVLVAGFVLAAFSVTGFGMRPVVGYWIDSWSQPGVLTVGTAILAVTGTLFAIPALWLLFIGNTARGIGWAAINTAGYTLLVRVAPTSRRGEASGYYTVTTNAATALAPVLALWLIAPPVGSYVVVFVLSGVAALGATLVVRLLTAEGAARETRAGPRGSGLRLASFLDRRVLLASFLLLCLTLTSPATTAFVPLYARELGIQNSGAYFAVSGAVSILATIALGRLFNRGSRGVWLVLGFGLSLLGLVILWAATGLELVVLSGAIYALGFSILSTMLLAVAIDLADPRRPGAAMATFSASYQLGMGLGAPIAGWLIEVFGYGGMYLGSMVAVGAGLLLTVANWPALGKQTAGEARRTAGQ